MRRWIKRIAIVAMIVTMLGAMGYGYKRYRYPYGSSHCCDKVLMFALQQYADDHGGAYPFGEATPEASLSLLYPKYASVEVLRGKTIPVEVVRSRLENGFRLTPETCGWHYVEGLTSKDNHRTALLWGKVALGHNGERTSDGGQMVLFVNLGHEYTSGKKWEAFLEEQQRLRAGRERRSANVGQE